MAVALQSTDNAAYGSTLATGGEQTSNTTAITVDAGTDRCMVVLIAGEGDGTATQAQVSSMTYNGDALTLGRREERSDWSWAEAWYLANPDTGTNNLVITLNEADNFNVKVLVATGVDQTTPMRTFNGTTGSATSTSVTVASVATDDLVFSILGLDSTGHNPTPGANETEVMERDSAIGGTESAAYTQPGSAGGVMSPAWTTSCPFSIVAGAFKAAAGGGATVERSAAIAATAAVTAANREFFTIFARSAALNATGLLASAPQRDLLRQAAVAATAAISTVPQRERVRQAAIAATAAVTAGRQIDHLRSAQIASSAAVTATGQIEGAVTEHERAAALNAAAAVTAAPQRELQRSTTIAATAGIASTALFFTTLERAAALAATGTITVAYQRDLHRQAALAALAAITAAGEQDGVITRAAALNATAAVTAAHQRELSRQAVLAAAAVITATSSVDVQDTPTVALLYVEGTARLTHTEASHITHTEQQAIAHRA